MSDKIIRIKVTANARREAVETGVGDIDLRVYVRAVAEKGKANEAVIKCLADYFKVPKSSMSILKGAQNSIKTIAIKTRE